MKALVKTRPGAGNVELIDVPEPECTNAGVKVEVKFGGICGTDIHVFHDTFKSYPPVILCHEFSGIVSEVGEEIKKVKSGDPVVVMGSIMVQCGTCEYCRQGFYMFCSIRRGMGHGVDGGFTKYVVVREDMVYPMPDHVSLEEAALAEPFATAVQAIEELTVFNVGDTVLLSGPGPIGLMCLALLVSHGCRVIVAGTSDDTFRLEVAETLGAHRIVDVVEQDIQDIVDRETNGRGVDGVVEASGSEAAVIAGFKAVRKMGQYVQVGILGKEITIDFDMILYKQLKVFGVLGHTLRTWDRVVQIFESEKIDLTPIISHVLPLSRWQEAFELFEKKKGLKILLSPEE